MADPMPITRSELAARAIVMSDGGGTIDTQGNTDIFTHNITGSTALTKTGTGLLVLDGTANQFGGITINAGNLQIGDAAHGNAVYTGAVTVDNGGTLSGHGAIHGNVTVSSGGTVAPGGSIGTTTITGNYTQSAGSTLSIEVSPSASSALVVSGVATLNGTLAFNFDLGSFTVGQSYNFLTAGSRTGTFTTVTGTPAGFRLSDLIYTSTGVSFSILAPLTPYNATIYTAMTTTQIDATQRANSAILDRLDIVELYGAGTASSSRIEGSNARLSVAASEYSGGIDDLVATLSDSVEGYGGWFKGTGSFGSQSANDTAPGFNNRGGGFLIGLDRRIARRLSLGIAGGYDHNEVNELAGPTATASADMGRFYLYMTSKQQNFTFGGSVGYSFGTANAQHYVALSNSNTSASYGQRAATAALQATVPVDLGDDMTLTPKAGLLYTHLMEDGFMESGAGTNNLIVSGRDTDSLQPFVGGTLATEWNDEGLIWKPEASLRYSHEAIKPNRQSNVISYGTAQTVAGNNPAADVITFGVGIAAKMDDAVDVYAHYDIDLPTANAINHTFSAGMKWKF